jgi:hypothetical protein
MPKMLALYFVTYIVFLSNGQQQLKNKMHNLLFIGKFEKPYELINYQIAPLNNIHILI